MNTLQEIFADHYEEILLTLHPRATEIENIDKMIKCGDPSYSGTMYACTKCGHMKFVPFRYHSQFCPTCGNLYAQKRADAMANQLVAVRRRHCIFTIPEELKHFFQGKMYSLDCPLKPYVPLVSRIFYSMNESKNFTPGFILYCFVK